MKRIAYLCGAVATMLAAPAFSQDIDIDTFEGYADTTTMKVVWPTTTGFPTYQLGTTGGAEGNNFLSLEDGGFGMTVRSTAFPAPAAGNYTMSFSFKNGIDGGEAMSALEVELIQDGAVKLNYLIGDTAATEWTAVSSAAGMLTNSAITLNIKASNGPAAVHKAYFDEFVITPVTDVPLEIMVRPDDRVYLSGNETLVATPQFGSETFTKVEFDVNNDGTVEFTDTEAPFEFAWNTLDHVAAGTSRTLSAEPANTAIPVKITVTDSENDTASVIEEYTVDNEFDGRESLIENGDFSQWQGAGFGSNLPVGWVENWVSGTVPQYGPGEGRNEAAGQALQIKFTNATSETGNFPDRYALRTNSHVGLFRDHQVTFWGKGDYCALYYMTSADEGVTFETTLVHAGIANSANWTYVVQTPVRSAADIGATATTPIALGTHQLGTTDHFWDDITWEANELPEGSSVDDWKLY